jgi:hypothetical protein
MSDRAHLPEFVREALEDRPMTSARDVQAGGRGEPPRPSREPDVGAQPLDRSELDDIERCFGALLEAAWPGEGVSVAGSTPATAESAVGGASGSDFAPSTGLFERLKATIDVPPFRYAPFFAKAADLFDLPESTIINELGRLAEPKVWRFAGLPGIHHATVQGGPSVASAETLFVRFAPGVRFPTHRHTALERVLVLEGSYRDSTGVVHRAGELREWAEGSEHGFVVDRGQPCIFASVVFGRRFNAWPLRAMAAVLGR